MLVALAVIFIPMLLPGKGDLGGIEGSNIPPEPDFRFPPVKAAPKAPPVADAPLVPLGDESADEKDEPAAKPVKVEPVKSESPTPTAKSQSKPAPKTETKPTPAPTTKTATDKPKPGTANAWVVQVGSFSDRKNARALRDKLRKQGYASFVESITGSAGRVYRVRVGPELSKAAAQKLSERLAKEAGLTGLVQAYP